MKNISFFCPHFSGAPKSESFCFQSEWLLYGREPNGGVRAELGKQKPRSCRTQELARSSGPRKWVAEKGWLTRLDESQYDGRTTSTCETKKTVANARVRMLPFESTAQKRARVSIASLGLGNRRRVVAVTARRALEGSRVQRQRTHRPCREFVLELGHHFGLNTVP
jgi:hypothetical protein